MVESSLQIVTGGVTVRTGRGKTVTVTCDVEVHPSKSPVTVYVVVEEGLAVTLEPVDELSEAEGLHI